MLRSVDASMSEPESPAQEGRRLLRILRQKDIELQELEAESAEAAQIILALLSTEVLADFQNNAKVKTYC